MAAFNPADYETVEQRLFRAYGDHPEMRVITENLTSAQDRQVSTWVVKAEIWFMDESGPFLKATGHAFEIDGQGMANKTSALENAETSAIGRALANAGYSGNKRASREEMEKVARANTPGRDWMAEAEALALVYDANGLRKLYSEAVANRVLPDIIEKIKAYGTDVASGSQDSSGKSGGSKGVA
jgi:poly-gamma-glutamate capsule biosynthesis protein CapA/YwtB (metallophosphatase superfamily)